MKHLFITLSILFAALYACAAENAAADTLCADTPARELLSVGVRARVDWQGDWHGSKMDDVNSGFEGKYIMLRLDGEIVPGLTYSWRQRFNKTVLSSSFFDATDWIYAAYSWGPLSVSAGKQIVAIGGWEYDRNPVDLFDTSVFWQNVPCYQLGGSISYQVSPGDNLLFQVNQSMFHTSVNKNRYGFNLLWTGNHGFYKSLWSVNLTEYAKHRYINYISLGNRFEFSPVALELDLMNRASSGQTFFFKDWSLVADLAWQIAAPWRIHAKFTYDYNKSGTDADLLVLDGTDMKMIGGGVEFYPLMKKRTSLRLHAACYYSFGSNPVYEDISQDRTTFLTVGLTWDMDLFRLRK